MEEIHYDDKVDIYSLGVILFELIYPCKNDEERFNAINTLQKNPFPKDIDERYINSCKEEVNS